VSVEPEHSFGGSSRTLWESEGRGAGGLRAAKNRGAWQKDVTEPETCWEPLSRSKEKEESGGIWTTGGSVSM